MWSWPTSRSTYPQLSRIPPQDNSALYKRWKRKTECCSSCMMMLKRWKKWRPILLNSHTFWSDFDDDILTAACIMRCEEKLSSSCDFEYFELEANMALGIVGMCPSLLASRSNQWVSTRKSHFWSAAVQRHLLRLLNWTKGVCSLCA